MFYSVFIQQLLHLNIILTLLIFKNKLDMNIKSIFGINNNK